MIKDLILEGDKRNISSAGGPLSVLHEELGTISIRSSIGHGQEERFVVLHDEFFVCKGKMR